MCPHQSFGNTSPQGVNMNMPWWVSAQPTLLLSIQHPPRPSTHGQGTGEEGEGTRRKSTTPPSFHFLSQIFTCSMLPVMCKAPRYRTVNVVERPLHEVIASIKNLAQLCTMENPRDCGINEGEYMREIQKWHCQAGAIALSPSHQGANTFLISGPPSLAHDLHPQGGLIPRWPPEVQLSDVHSRQQDEEGTRAKECTFHLTHGPC